MLINDLVKHDSPSDPLSAIFAALADPTRRAILDILGRGEASVNELAEPFDMTLPAISRHLKVLERAGLISRGRKAQWRPCRIEIEPFDKVSSWIDHHHKLWSTSLENLDGYLKKMQAQKNKKNGDGNE